MAFDSRRLVLVVGQAAHHLHMRITHVATTLLDTSGHGRMLFSNSALSYIDGRTLTRLASEDVKKTAEKLPCLYTHPLKNPAKQLFMLVLDERHVFAIVAHPHDEPLIQEFKESLNHLLYSVIV